MAISYKTLGAVAVGSPLGVSVANAIMYTVPAGKQAVISSINLIANNVITVNASSSFGVYAVKSGNTYANASYVIAGISIPYGQTNTYNLGMTLGAGDSIVITGSMGQYTGVAFGAEIT